METQLHRKLIGQYERQLKSIHELKSEVNMVISNEHPMETLANSALRQQVVNEVMQTSEVKIPKNQITGLKEEEEL